MQTPYLFEQGQIPLLVSMPHSGIHIPADIQAKLTPVSQVLSDTDWHLPRLYNMLQELGASQIQAKCSRYVVDLNRSSDDANLYPGQDTTGLCPVDTFDKQPLYLNSNHPTTADVQNRVNLFWQPYHQKIQEELKRMRDQFGVAILWDAHSIASQVPRFFDGKLTDLNFGTADQKSCSLSLQEAIENSLKNTSESSQFSHIFNGRFKGGYITREYGKPEENIHAVQLEMSQCLYMDEVIPYGYREDLAKQIQPVLKALLQTCIEWAKNHSSQPGQPSQKIKNNQLAQ